MKPEQFRSCLAPQSKVPRDYPKTISINPDNNTILDFCLLRCDHPEKHLQIVGSRGLLRNPPRVAFSGSDLLGRTRHTKYQLDAIQATRDAPERLTSNSSTTNQGSDEDKSRLSYSGPRAFVYQLVIEEAYAILNENV